MGQDLLDRQYMRIIYPKIKAFTIMVYSEYSDPRQHGGVQYPPPPSHHAS